MNRVANIATARSAAQRASEAEPVNTDARSYMRLGWLIVLLGVGGFII